ncbi:MAG: META domain-containing protein [Gammaproteobacteria bacterium]
MSSWWYVRPVVDGTRAPPAAPAASPTGTGSWRTWAAKTGSWETKDGALVLSPLAMTRRACIEGMDTEQRYAVALEQVAGYEIEGERLVLRDADGEPLAVFE